MAVTVDSRVISKRGTGSRLPLGGEPLSEPVFKLRSGTWETSGTEAASGTSHPAAPGPNAKPSCLLLLSDPQGSYFNRILKIDR